jgi:hypothetical protein
MQLEAAVHETAARFAPADPAGLGMDWSVQVLPFQDSASGVFDSPPWTWVPENPTAMQLDAAVHETPFRVPSFAPVGSGVGWIAQWVAALAAGALVTASAAAMTVTTKPRRMTSPLGRHRRAGAKAVASSPSNGCPVPPVYPSSLNVSYKNRWPGTASSRL